MFRNIQELFAEGVDVEEPKRNEEQAKDLRATKPQQETKERNLQQPPYTRRPEQEQQRKQERRQKRDEQADQPHHPPGKPDCDLHPLELQGEEIGKCCTFLGSRFHRYHGPLRVVLPSPPLEGAGESTEAPVATTTETANDTITTAVKLPDLSTRFFIDSACKKGYVLDANYECVPEF